MLSNEDRIKEINKINLMKNEELKNYYRQLNRKVLDLVNNVTTYRSSETNGYINELLETNEKMNLVVNRVVGKAIYNAD